MKTVAYKLLGSFLLLILAFGCAKQPETIVIDNEPESPTNIGQRDTAVTPTTSAEFKQLIIGEPHPITTLDPLFADNNSAKRTLQIVFEGLVRYNQQGNIVPGIATRWQVSEDSLRYGFVLNDNLFYHDSSIFNNGLGRKVVAGDVKYAFERMARNNVPSDAAQLFMAIDGFEPFFNEQHNVLNPAYRELSGVSGIQAPNDSTVVFSLEEKDQHFLQKLASPYALIYPREAVNEDPGNFSAVGSGPFQLSQQVGDSLYVFSKNNEYQQPDNTVPVLDRVDVMVEENQSLLLQALASGNVHIIPELGPRILTNIMLPDGSGLSPAYVNDYIMTNPGGITTYDLQYNTQSVTPRSAIRSLFSEINPAEIGNELPENIISIEASADSISATDEDTEMPSTVLSTYSEDPYQQWFLQQISNAWNGQPSLQILRIRTPSRHTALYTSSFVPVYAGQSQQMRPNELLRYSVVQSVLSIQGIEGELFNQFPWWIDLRTVDMPGIDQL